MSCRGGDPAAVSWDEEALRARRDPKLRRRVARYFRPYLHLGLAVLVLIIAAAVVGLVPVLMTKDILDYLTDHGRNFSHVALLISVGLGASAVVGLLGMARSFLEASISQAIMFDLRGQLVDRLLDQSVGFFTETRVGEVMSRISNDVDEVEDVVSGTVFGMVYNLLVVVATLAFMAVLNWRLTLLLPLVAGPLIIVPTRRAERVTFEVRKRTQEQLARMTVYLQEILGISGIMLVKAFARQGDERARFRHMNEQLRRLQMRQEIIAGWFGMLMQTLWVSSPAVLWLYGGYLVMRGQATVGTIVIVVVVLAGRLAGAATDLATFQVNVTGSLALFQRLFDVIDMPVSVSDIPGARQLTSCRGEISFDNITFAYRPDGNPAVEDLSFRIEPGQLVALVGPTGAGKSTVTYLASRMYDPQQGRVLIDGQDVRELNLESLNRHIGIVYQETFLFHSTIRDNLRYARSTATDDELVAAAQAAYLHDFISSLPEGYDTIVGERGHRLSGGEKQRLAIARVIIKDPRIFIFDEATSHLDAVSEHLIQAAVQPLLNGRTSLVIAHRLSTIRAADVILVLDQGRLAERGTHTDLLKLGGTYARLYQHQFSTQDAELPQFSLTPPG